MIVEGLRALARKPFSFLITTLVLPPRNPFAPFRYPFVNLFRPAGRTWMATGREDACQAIHRAWHSYRTRRAALRWHRTPPRADSAGPGQHSLPPRAPPRGAGVRVGHDHGGKRRDAQALAGTA